MRTARLAAVLLGLWFLFWGIAARADQPETFERGTGKYVLVLKDPRTDADDPVTGKKKAREPDLVRHGGKLLHRKGNTRIIKLPVRAAAALSEDENVAYLQRIWLGEPAEEWTAGPFASSVKADSAVVPHETNLTWETGQYQYDGSGNIQRIGDDTYEYDTLGRLKKAVLNGVTASYQYDAFGNLVARTVGGVTRATPVDASSNRLQGETYDLAGNLTTQDRTPVYHYDSFSMIDRVQKRRTGAITDQRILYGPDDERIGTVREEGIRSRWTIRDFGGKVLTEYEADDENGHWTWSRDYVYGGDGRLLGADRHSYHGGQRHFHLDHLGTVRMITNQQRQRISVHELYPFGVEQTDATQEHNRLVPDGVVGSAPEFRSEPMKFTGHERDWHGWLNVDNDEYLDYMHARYYDPNLGRFLSVDPGKDWDPKQPQSWNMYTYVRNNPINTIDPTGKWGWSDFKQWVGERSDALSNWWREKWHNDIPAPADQYGGVEALEAAGYSQAEAQELGNPQARWANARAETGAIISDEASREIATQVAMSAIGGIVVKGLSREALMLRKALASEAQMAEAGQAIAGAGTRTALRDTPRLVATYGGEAADWVKMRSSTYTAADGVRFETHWYQNIRTGERIEFKTKF